MPASFLQTVEYARRRKAAIEWRLLQRGYYAGNPYSADPIFQRKDYGMLWQSLLMPSEQSPEEYPNYIDNVARAIIDQMAGDIIPPGSRLIYEGLSDTGAAKEEGAASDDIDPRVKALNNLLFNFGPHCAPGIDGFFEWLELMAVDQAQSGDGILIPTAVPVGGRKGYNRFNYYPYELWDCEEREDASDIDYYRVEYKFVGRDGNTYWRRFDITRTEIIRYTDKEVRAAWDMSAIPADVASIYSDPSLMGFIAPPMEKREAEPLTDLLEKLTLQGLGEWLPTPIRWRRGAMDEYRGDPELTGSELSAIDDINRLMTKWKDAAAGAGEPALFAIDLSMPVDEGAGGGADTLRAVRPGEFYNVSSDGDHQGRVMFPDNVPTQFPHGAVLDYVRQAVLGDTPNIGLNPNQISRFGELSGFASKTLRGSYDKRIDKHRLRMLTNGVLLGIKKAINLLALKGWLPDGIDPTKIEPRIEFAAQEYNPDEMVKMMTVVQLARTLGATVKDQVALLPFKPINPEETEAGMDESMKQGDLLAQMAADAAAAPPGGQGDGGAKPRAGSGAKPKAGKPTRPAAT